MHFDVVELGRRLESVVLPVQVLEPSGRMCKLVITQRLGDASMGHEKAPVDIRISAADGAEVAFEVTVVHRVESNLCEPLSNMTR